MRVKETHYRKIMTIFSPNLGIAWSSLQEERHNHEKSQWDTIKSHLYFPTRRSFGIQNMDLDSTSVNNFLHGLQLLDVQIHWKTLSIIPNPFWKTLPTHCYLPDPKNWLLGDICLSNWSLNFTDWQPLRNTQWTRLRNWTGYWFVHGYATHCNVSLFSHLEVRNSLQRLQFLTFYYLGTWNCKPLLKVKPFHQLSHSWSCMAFLHF